MSASDASQQPQPQPPVTPMSYSRFRRLWRGSSHTRNQTLGFEEYRDAYVMLLAASVPHLARLAIPRYLQPPLVDFFRQYGEHQFYVEPCPSGERVRLTIWRPGTGSGNTQEEAA